VEKMPKTTKKIKEINGQQVEQRLESSKFIQDWQTWKSTSPETGYEFLMKHGIQSGDSERRNTTFQQSKGHLNYIRKLDDILDFDEFIGQVEIDFLIKYKEFIEEAEGTNYDPAKIVYHEKVYGADGKLLRRVPVWGHWATKKFIKRATENGKDYGPEVNEDWYTYDANKIANNPPHQAIYSATATEFAKPKGLLYILEDAIKELIKMENIFHIRKVRNAGRLMELPEIKTYLEGLMNGTYFENGRMKGPAIANALKGQKFEVQGEAQEKLIRDLADISEKEIAGDILYFIIDTTPVVIEQMYMASSKRKAGGYYIHGKRMDKRPRKEGVPVAKSWMDWLR
jgi:hypothetical protein